MVNCTFLRSNVISDQLCGDFLKQAIMAGCYSANVFGTLQTCGAWTFRNAERDQDNAGGNIPFVSGHRRQQLPFQGIDS
jgi:hypothetical protein